MPTRCIFAVTGHSLVHAVSCQYEGYPNYVIPLLTNFCLDDESRSELVGHGNISDVNGVKLHGEKPKLCVRAYHRDLGEPLRWLFQGSSEEFDASINVLMKASWAEYAYWYREDRWTILNEGEWVGIDEYKRH